MTTEEGSIFLAVLASGPAFERLMTLPGEGLDLVLRGSRQDGMFDHMKIARLIAEANMVVDLSCCVSFDNGSIERRGIPATLDINKDFLKEV